MARRWPCKSGSLLAVQEWLLIACRSGSLLAMQEWLVVGRAGVAINSMQEWLVVGHAGVARRYILGMQEWLLIACRSGSSLAVQEWLVAIIACGSGMQEWPADTTNTSRSLSNHMKAACHSCIPLVHAI